MDINLSALYQMLGNPLTYTAPDGTVVSGRGIYAMPGQVSIDLNVVMEEPSIRYPVAQFPAVKKDGVFTLATGARYRVRANPSLISDGQEAYVNLEGVK